MSIAPRPSPISHLRSWFVLLCFCLVAAGAQAASPPTITSFSPQGGPVGSTVVIQGTNFTPPLSIAFGGNVLSEGSFSPTQIMATVPSGAQTGPITVQAAGGSVSTASNFIVGVPGNPEVTVAATTPSVVAGSGLNGVFTLTLSSASTENVVVNYSVGGTAVNGTDYTLLSGTAKVKAGATTKEIKVDPLGNFAGPGKKTVKLTLTVGDGYTVGTFGSVKVKILPGQ